MVHKYKLIEVEEARSLKKRLDALDDAYYIDRSIIAPNRGLNGEVGAYHSIGDKSLPKDLLEDLRKIAPKKDLPLTKIVVNKYLTDEEVNSAFDAIVSNLSSKFSARLRS